MPNDMNVKMTVTFNVESEGPRNGYAISYSVVGGDGRRTDVRLEDASINEAVQAAAEEIEYMIGAAIRRQRRDPVCI